MCVIESLLDKPGFSWRCVGAHRDAVAKPFTMLPPPDFASVKSAAACRRGSTSFGGWAEDEDKHLS